MYFTFFPTLFSSHKSAKHLSLAGSLFRASGKEHHHLGLNQNFSFPEKEGGISSGKENTEECQNQINYSFTETERLAAYSGGAISKTNGNRNKVGNRFGEGGDNPLDLDHIYGEVINI